MASVVTRHDCDDRETGSAAASVEPHKTLLRVGFALKVCVGVSVWEKFAGGLSAVFVTGGVCVCMYVIM